MVAKQTAHSNGCWIIDRKISLGLILAIILQVIVMITWLVRIEQRVVYLEASDAKQDAQMSAIHTLAAGMEGLKSDISWIRDTLTSLKVSHTQSSERK